MILTPAATSERNAAIDELAPFVKRDIKATLEAMDGLPVTIRLLDPPLHEFVPQSSEKQAELAKALGITVDEVKARGDALHEVNPMMGHRGVRLGITYPELTEMQIRAIFEAAAELNKARQGPASRRSWCRSPATSTSSTSVKPIFDASRPRSSKAPGVEDRVPLRHDDRDSAGAPAGRQDGRDGRVLLLRHQRPDADGLRLQPRRHRRLPAATTWTRGILDADPFQTIDQEGIGQLIEMAVEKGRATRPDLKVGICGEQGGDPASVDFCFKTGLNYVSCSPYRVPIARLAAAQAAINATAVAKPRPGKRAKK